VVNQIGEIFKGIVAVDPMGSSDIVLSWDARGHKEPPGYLRIGKDEHRDY
jgi:hypothetical protein